MGRARFAVRHTYNVCLTAKRDNIKEFLHLMVPARLAFPTRIQFVDDEEMLSQHQKLM